MIAFCMFIFGRGEAERGSELITSFWTVLTYAFLLYSIVPGSDIHLQQKKKKKQKTQNQQLSPLNICKIREGGEFRAQWEYGVIEHISESRSERQQTPYCVALATTR